MEGVGKIERRVEGGRDRGKREERKREMEKEDGKQMKTRISR